MEGYDGSVKGVKTLIDGGVNTAIKTGTFFSLYFLEKILEKIINSLYLSTPILSQFIVRLFFIHSLDHPIIYAKYFMLEAAKALHYGLTWQQAIRVVTMNPAKAIELSDRIGFFLLFLHIIH